MKYIIEVTMNPIRTMLGGACVAIEAIVKGDILRIPDTPTSSVKYTHTVTMNLGEVEVKRPLTEAQITHMENAERYKELFPGVEKIKVIRIIEER